MIQPEAFSVNVTVTHQENKQLDKTLALHLGPSSTLCVPPQKFIRLFLNST